MRSTDTKSEYEDQSILIVSKPLEQEEAHLRGELYGSGRNEAEARPNRPRGADAGNDRSALQHLPSAFQRKANREEKRAACSRNKHFSPHSQPAGFFVFLSAPWLSLSAGVEVRGPRAAFTQEARWPMQKLYSGVGIRFCDKQR
jgi:hypothetical protein